MQNKFEIQEYDFRQIEKKWQDFWDKTGIFNPLEDYSKPKYYVLSEFPYPSGDGLHVGHPRGYTAMDVVARYKRLKGFNVLFPFGWDAFGLPTENYAIKNNIHPKIATENNIKRFKSQCKAIGFSFAWDREINTTDPNYYKWTQWIFLQLFKKGLAYKDNISINWCTSCNIGLANEEVVNNQCERCGGDIIRKKKEQWMLKITEYAEQLIGGLEEVNYIEKVKISQINWIGKSEGATVDFKIENEPDKLTVFTTRPDTLWGATYMVVAPEHPLIEKYSPKIKNNDEVQNYIKTALRKSDLERSELTDEKTGVELMGIKAVNPVNDELLPIWISDYILMSYGTGAIMAVPAHDQRDYEFAKKFNLKIREVISGGDISKEAFTEIENGVMVNSGFITGLKPKDAILKTIDWLVKNNLGAKTTNYKLRDWVFSRQRYWGEPIPVVKCEKCGWVAMRENELPLTLPDIEDYKTTADGESALSRATSWVNSKCPKCLGKAKRETDTMPNWAGSSWYYLRYTDSNNDTKIFDEQKQKYWMPVDWYNGGMEHTTLHLLYSRFWHKVLYELGYVSTPEPYIKRTSHGMVLGINSEKMSKSRGNVINPDDIINQYGADTFRLYEMFMGAFDQAIPWSSEQISGMHRFLFRIWNTFKKVDFEKPFEDIPLYHQTTKKVEDDINSAKYNTAIAQIMTLLNEISQSETISKKMYESLLILISPFAPHIAEELWSILQNKESIQKAKWPIFDSVKAINKTMNFPITVNGKLRDTIVLPLDLSEEEVRQEVEKSKKVMSHIGKSTIVKIIFVKNKIFNIVIKS